MRPVASPLHLHETFRTQLRAYSILTGISELRLFRICGVCNEQIALKILHNKSKQTAQSMARVLAVGAFIGAPYDETVIGDTMPRVPHEMLVPIIDDVIAAVEAPHVKTWLTRWRNYPCAAPVVAGGQ